jgi:hypothetical protein
MFNLVPHVISLAPDHPYRDAAGRGRPVADLPAVTVVEREVVPHGVPGRAP